MAIISLILGGCGGSTAAGPKLATVTTTAADSVTRAPAPADPSTTTPGATEPVRTATTSTARRTVPSTRAPARVTTTGPPSPTTVLVPACPPTLANQLASTGGASQLVTVDAASNASTTAAVMLWQRTGRCWTVVAGPWTAHIGIRGLSSHHREGDGTTPTGSFGVLPVAYGVGPNPGVQFPYHQLVCGDWWDEDPASPQYNTFQHVACGTTPSFGGASEELWKATTAYRSLIVLDYNTHPVIAGAGSGIFVHNDLGHGTNGCVSLQPSQLDLLLRWLQPNQARLVIGAEADIRRF